MSFQYRRLYYIWNAAKQKENMEKREKEKTKRIVCVIDWIHKIPHENFNCPSQMRSYTLWILCARTFEHCMANARPTYSFIYMFAAYFIEPTIVFSASRFKSKKSGSARAHSACRIRVSIEISLFIHSKFKRITILLMRDVSSEYEIIHATYMRCTRQVESI